MNPYLRFLEENSQYTCIIYLNDEIVFTSTAKGVKPMLDFYHKTKELNTGYIVLDRIMGRSAVILAKLIHADTIITPTISETAYQLAKEYQMNITYTNLVPFIINRDQTGRCPIESSVLNISDPNIGYNTIIDTLKKLSKKD